MSIKSVHLTNYYHRDSGGISTAYNKLLEAANRHRRFVRLIVPGEETSIEEVGEFGRIYYIKAGYSPVFDKRYRILLPWNTYIFDKSPIKKILREEKPDIIEIGEKYTLSLMAGLIRKGIMKVSPERPMLLHFSCERMDDNVGAFLSRGGIARRLTSGFVRNYLFPMFDFHLANSDYTAAELRDVVSSERTNQTRLKNFCWRLFRTPRTNPSDRVFVNQCGVDIAKFSVSRKSEQARRRIRSRHSIPETAKLLLYAGRLSPEKNVALLPMVMQELLKSSDADLRLLVAGGGPEQERLTDEFAKTGGGKVIMLGHLNDADELADLFANCDAFVHPNPREPFGITPLEAMASGLPVVAPNSGGVLSYADQQNAWLCDADPECFSSVIHAIFKDEVLRHAKIQNALETALRYDWESATTALFRLYDKMFEEFSNNRGLYVYDTPSKDLNFSQESVSHA